MGQIIQPYAPHGQSAISLPQLQLCGGVIDSVADAGFDKGRSIPTRLNAELLAN